MFTYKIFDDLVSEELADKIESYCTRMPWYYQKNISGIPREAVLPLWVRGANIQNGFASKIYEPDSRDMDKEAFDLVYPLLSDVKDMIPIETSIVRVRGGMFLRNLDGGAHTPHVDYYLPHYTLLYYVNDSDGDTIIWNEKVSKDNPQAYPERFTILDRITPRKGRAVLFNGLHYHSSSFPKVSPERMVINSNILTF